MQNHVVVRNEKQSITGFAWSLLAVTSTVGALCLRTFYTGNKAGVSSTILCDSVIHGKEFFFFFFFKVGISNLPDGFADGEFEFC